MTRFIGGSGGEQLAGLEVVGEDDGATGPVLGETGLGERFAAFGDETDMLSFGDSCGSGVVRMDLDSVAWVEPDKAGDAACLVAGMELVAVLSHEQR